MSNLQNLRPHENQKKKGKRVGRGNGSGAGTYSGRGMNGQNSRTGGGVRPGFEGGQTPFFKRLPKNRGFKAINPTIYQVVNVSSLEEKFEDNSTITIVELAEKNLIKGKKPVKLLNRGEVTKKFNITVDAASKTAISAIEKAGGSVTIIA